MLNRLNCHPGVAAASQPRRASMMAAVLLACAQFCLTSPALAADTADAAKARTGSTVVVHFGVTARDVAAEHAPAGVTQEQMLVALQRANPNAFAGGNVNRLLAGTALALPTAEQALQVSEPKARQLIAAQGREFNAQQMQAAPALLAVSSTEAATGPQPAATPAAAEAPAAPAAAIPEANLQPTPAAAVNEPSGGVTPAATPAVDASVNLAQTGLISQLIDHPAVLPATGGLLVLMAALAVLRSRQRRQAYPASSTANPAPTSATPEAKFDPRLNAALLAGEAAAVAISAVAVAEATNAAPAPAVTPEVPAALLGHFNLDLSLGNDSTVVSAPAAAMLAPSAQPAAALGNNQPVPKAKPAPEFDLGSISLDLGSTPATPASSFNMSSISLDLADAKPPPTDDKAAP